MDQSWGNNPMMINMWREKVFGSTYLKKEVDGSLLDDGSNLNVSFSFFVYLQMNIYNLQLLFLIDGNLRWFSMDFTPSGTIFVRTMLMFSFFTFCCFQTKSQLRIKFFMWIISLIRANIIKPSIYSKLSETVKK